jgi:hypothetical protein
MRLFIGILIPMAFWLGTEVRSEITQPTPAAQKVSLCALQENPATYNHKMIDVRAVVSHGLNDFTLSDPRCEPRSRIWLEYGGRVNSETVYCCGVKAGPRAADLVVEGIATRLIDDGLFRRFDARVRTKGDVSFRGQYRPAPAVRLPRAAIRQREMVRIADPLRGARHGVCWVATSQ